MIRSKVETPQVNTTYTTPEFMPMLGFTFHLGRGPSADEGLNSMQPIAVLSYQAWQKYYGQAADIVGQSIQIDQVNFKIIGVLSEQNREPEMLTPGRLTDVWLPWDYYSFQRRDAQHWGITLLIALIGIYGVLNYGVSMRRYELRVRIAIGASPKSIVLGLLGENTKVICTALGCATFATVAAMAWLASSEVMFSVSLLGFVLPLSLIIGITAATTVLAASGVITKPALYSLRSH